MCRVYALSASRPPCQFLRWLFTLAALLSMSLGCGNDEPSKPVVVTVEPATATVEVNQMQQFMATVTGATNRAVTWSVDGEAENGTISATGLYTAPATVPNPATVTVRVTSDVDASKSASAAVTIVLAAPAPTDLVLVPAGTFVMGDGVAHCGTEEHRVTLTHDFYLGQTEVTNAQYLDALNWANDQGFVTATTKVVTDNLEGSAKSLVYLTGSNCEVRYSTDTGRFVLWDAGHGMNPDHPMKGVTWYGAAAYCDWLSLREGWDRAYSHQTWQCNFGYPYGAVGYRLPTDAEWEYAAQYNDERIYPWGNEAPDCTRANCSGTNGACVGWTRPVGSYPAEKEINGKGLYDMAGNVWEWCNDWATCNLGKNPATDPVGPLTGSDHVFRGGGFSDVSDAGFLRCANRDYYIIILSSPSAGSWYGDGFRVARTVVPTTVVSVSVLPTSGTVQVGFTQQFMATVIGAANTAVDWTVDGGGVNGTIDNDGLYTAPLMVPNPVAVTVRATSQADPSQSGTATVRVAPIMPAQPVFVHVPAGSFTMGDGVAQCGVQQHRVTLTRGFDLGQYEVTNRQYLALVQWAYDRGLVAVENNIVYDRLDGRSGTEIALLYLGDSTWEMAFSGGVFSLRDAGHGINPDHPVKGVTWYGAVAYADWLSLEEGLPRAYDHVSWICGSEDPYAAAGYRLPTDAEWEYAAQYNDERIYPWGNEAPDCKLANWWGRENGCAGWTSIVASYPAEKEINGKGLYDMAGNVWEWCNDWYVCDLGVAATQDPGGPTSGIRRVTRGGGWGDYINYLRSAARDDTAPSIKYAVLGFRVARTITP